MLRIAPHGMDRTRKDSLPGEWMSPMLAASQMHASGHGLSTAAV
jgi:hypothetical protein